MKVREAVTKAMQELERSSDSEARLHAEVLLMDVLDCDRAFLFAHPEHELSDEQLTRFHEAVGRRAQGEPLQYITGHQEFWKLDFLVSPSVLIPRPETEHLVESALELAGQDRRDRALKIVDVGTGSGAIAISLAHELPKANVLAVDLSADALAIAEANASRLGVRNIRFQQSDVLAAVDCDGSFDFVVSNPPYVGLNEEDKVQDVVKHYEPHMAVFAGKEGLDVIRRLIPQALEALQPGGWLLIEIGYSMSEAVMNLLNGWDMVHAVPDLAGIPRVIVAQKPTGASQQPFDR